ncbi:MAG: hypothetical protein V1712_00650 [Patescibacteria group bacterium]
MSIELDGWVRKLTPKELKIEEQKKQGKKIDMPTERQINKIELPQHCPACQTFTGGADICPNCEETIPPLETK